MNVPNIPNSHIYPPRSCCLCDFNYDSPCFNLINDKYNCTVLFIPGLNISIRFCLSCWHPSLLFFFSYMLFVSLQTCLRRWSPWQCSSQWVSTTRGRLTLLTDWWEQWGRPPTCAMGTLSVRPYFACASHLLYRWNYFPINMSVSALFFIKNV